MSIDSSQIESLIKYTTPSFLPKKTSLVNFLREIYTNVSKRSNNNMNTYTFQEILQLPMIISDKIYFALNEHGSKMITQTQFSNGIYQLLYNDLLYKFRICFEIFDFDNDGSVCKDDAFLILSHFHLIQNTNESINYLEKVIDNFFLNDETLTKEEYFERCKSISCDVSLLLIIFINNYLFFFTEKEIDFYEKTISLFDSVKSNTSTNDGTLYIKNGYFKPTSALVTYLENIALDRFDLDKSIFELSLDENDNDDLEDLNAFEKDINNAFQKLSMNEIAYNNKITKNKTYMPKQKPLRLSTTINTQNNQTKGKEQNGTEMNSSHFDDTKNETNKNLAQPGLLMKGTITSNIIQKNNKNQLQKAVTDFTSTVINVKHKKNEVIFYKAKNNTKTNIIIKLTLVNRSIFYFKQIKNVFVFRKILPIFSLYPKRIMLNSLVQFNLISTVHNHYKQYSFFADNIEEIDTFIQMLNNNANNEKINENFEFKHDLGKGKFGSVVLAMDKRSNGAVYAIKIVNKNNPTDEEYKINRWESTIFSTLKNISHPNVIKCYEKYENEKNIFFVYEYIKGSDLKIFTQMHPNSNIRNIINISLQIINGIACLHKYGIIHRDIKTTNILIENSLDNKYDNKVKIIDFGLSRVLGKNEFSLDPYGSLCFKAPELIKHLPYNFKVDVWAIGITIYYLIFRVLPFEKGNKQQIKESIVNDNLNFPIVEMTYDASETNNESNNGSFLYALIGECLEKKVESRPSIERIMDKYVEKYQEDDF